MKKNPFAARLAAFAGVLREKQLDAAVVFNQANVRSLTGIDCDNACLLVKADGTVVFHTDFRYVPMVHRVAPWLKVDDIKKVGGARPFRSGRAKLLKMGYESSVTHARFMQLEKAFPGATFADIDANVKELRAVKTADELAKLRAAEALNDAIWSEAQKEFKPGMTEKDMARVIQHL
ncbi:MAG: aminopeptidase P family N-terminal domain-containing protein, partial [Kiritimatiellia bacterium]|nr:aminopeptidase P family N-terminal domain-containing protein [Kiritimatiellia bacterium]